MGSSGVGSDFVVCSKCGKKLIERKRNGLWHFLFGKPGSNGGGFVPVEMFIQGNVKIKCLRRTCQHWNVLNYFPNVLQSEGLSSESPDCTEKVNKITLSTKEV